MHQVPTHSSTQPKDHMSNYTLRLIAAFGLMAVASAFAQVPAAAPSGTTGLCKDGSYSSNATKAGACSGHKGVKTWYASPASAPTPASSAATKVAAPAASASQSAAKAPPTDTKKAISNAAPAIQAPGGGAGQVWVNASSKTYHCFGTQYYGKTKQGQYMTEAAAKAAGNHGDHGKTCGG